MKILITQILTYKFFSEENSSYDDFNYQPSPRIHEYPPSFYLKLVGKRAEHILVFLSRTLFMAIKAMPAPLPAILVMFQSINLKCGISGS